jgi:DNA mismatch endonuclease (patch repair protein)
MADLLSAEERSRNMSLIRGAHTHPERVLRGGLHRAGLRFRLHRNDLEGRPDVVLPRYSAAIFVHGCFWHQHPGCRDATMPKTRKRFWTEKFAQNHLRDKRQTAALLAAGWRVLIVWECALKAVNTREAAIAEAIRWIVSSSSYAEVARSTEKSGRSRPRRIARRTD